MASATFSAERLTRSLRRYAIVVPLLLGVVSLLAAIPLRSLEPLLLGLGSSLIASYVFARFALVPDELTESMMALGVREIFSDRRRDLRDDFWLELLQNAKHYYQVLGTANSGYAGDQPRRDKFGPAFLAAVRRNVVVTIIWLDPESTVAQIRDQEEGRATRLDTVNSIIWFWECREGLSVPERERLRLLLHGETPTCGVTWVDEQVVVINYLARTLNLEAPGMLLSTTRHRWPVLHRLIGATPAEGALATSYTNNLRDVEARSRPINARDVERLETLRPSFDTGPSQASIRKMLDDAEGSGTHE